jgi:hypothetical protein
LSPEGYPILAGKPPPPTPQPQDTLAEAIGLAKSAQLAMTHGSSYGWRAEVKLTLAQLIRLLERLDAKEGGV